MAEIRQELGIDVSQAIQAVNSLDRRLEQFGSGLDNLGRKLSNFNSTARRAFRLGNLSGDLDSTAQATQRVVQGFAGFAGAASSASSASQAAASSLRGIAGATQSVAQSTNNLGASVSSGTSRAAAAFQRFVAAIRGGRAGIRGELNALQSQFRAFGQQSAQAFSPFLLGFQTLTRIFQAQVIIRGLNAIGSALADGTRNAIDFQRTIAEIQTISSGAFRDFENGAEAVRQISDAFNLPLGEVGEGLYQTISNQIQGAANQTNVLEQASVLAKVGVADLSDTVELLTGTLNAFQLQSADADRVSAILFKTVELGRTRISELNNSFGTVQTLAAEAGASLEELAAAFAAVTINGVDTAKAATQIRGVLNAIIKPTEELQAVFEEAGFAEGALAVETIGLADTIQLISDAAGGSQAELAKLVPRLRGITAQLVLARNGGEQFQRSLDEINRAAAEGIDEEFQIIIDTDAERVTKAINQLSNALTVDLGQSILGVIRPIAEFEGGIQFATRAVQILGPVLLVAAGAYTVYAARAGFAAAANSAFAASVLRASAALATNPIVLAAAAFAATVGAIRAAESSANQAAENVRQNAARASQERLSAARKERAELVAEDKRGIDERFRNVTDFVRKIRSAVADRTRAWEQSNDQILRDTETVLDRILSANKDLVRNLKQEAEDAAQAQIDSQQRVNDLRVQGEDAAFNASLRGRNAIQRSFLQQQRAAELASKASQDLATAQTEAEIESALATAQRAQSAAQEAVSSAETSGNRAAVTRALATQQGISDQLISAEERLQQLQLQRQTAAEAAAREEEARVAKLSDAIDKLLDLQQEFDPSASPVDREKILGEIKDAFSDVRQLSVPENGKLDASQLISFAQFQQDFINGLKLSEAQGIDVNATLSGAGQQRLSQEIEDTVAEAFRRGINRGIEAGIDPNAFAGAIDAQRTQGPTQALDALTKALNSERDRLKQVADNAELVRRSTEDLATATQSATGQLTRGLTIAESLVRILQTPGILATEGARAVTGGGDTIGFTEGQERLRQLGEEAARLPLESFGKTEDQINVRLQSLQRQFQEVIGRLDAVSRRTLAPELRQAADAFRDANEAINRAEQQGSLTGEQIDSALEGARQPAKDIETSAEGASTAAGSFQGALNQAAGRANQLVGASARIRDNFREAAAASAQVGAPGGGGPATQNAAFGGMIRYFNKGGFAPRGTDTVPAMLSPGEFVVNAKSTRRFFGQLQAMNAGVTPRFLQDGGPVTNISIGDVNVSASDTKSGDITGRQIARSLDRELRRRTSSLRRT